MGVVKCEFFVDGGVLIFFSDEHAFFVCGASQGLLLLAILGGVSTKSSFDSGAGLNKTKGYLIFVLAYTAITNSVVREFISIYFRFFSYSVSFFFYQRFAGSTLYLIARLITG